MEGVGAVVFVGGNVMRFIIECVSAVFDSAGVTTDYAGLAELELDKGEERRTSCSKVGMLVIGIVDIQGTFVVTHDYILENSVLILDEEIRVSRSVANIGGTDAIRRDCVFHKISWNFRRILGAGKKAQ